MESIEEKNEIKKVTEVASRLKSAKKTPTKAAEVEQGKEHDPIMVTCTKKKL